MSLKGMCLRRYEKACNVGELSFDSRQPHVNNKWDVDAFAEFWDWLEEEISKDRALTEVEDFEGEAVSKWRFGACNKGKKPGFTDMHGPVVLTIEYILGYGNPTSHKPELVLNNFTTRLGHRIGEECVKIEAERS
ncbi:hypothetical protein K1719_032624 [Acacia pycnantha]|nr:hypothetical protein K1719_032624 [Acacia pycnantha]